jgi:hypothetical protein
MLAKVHAVVLEQPGEIVVLGGDLPIGASGDISQNPGQGGLPID